MRHVKKDDLAIHQYYIDIINSMPSIVYWVDLDCMFKGCNINFIKLLGLSHLKNFVGTPYEQMKTRLPWAEARIEALKLDDMSALFSGVAEYDVEEPPFYSKDGDAIYYRSTRTPIFDADKNLIGLVVTLSDITELKVMQTKYNQDTVKNELSRDIKRENKPVRVLVVEDSVIAQNVEQALFLALNCEVDIAESGAAASTLFLPGKYDIVFMDIGLQDTSGYMVSKKFREMEKDSGLHVPIIALTSYKAEIVQYDCKDYAMDDVITKPITSEQAEQLINRYVYHID